MIQLDYGCAKNTCQAEHRCAVRVSTKYVLMTVDLKSLDCIKAIVNLDLIGQVYISISD